MRLNQAEAMAPRERSSTNRPSSLGIAICWFQGAYWLITGVWPLVSIGSFQAITGPKTDHLVTGSESDHWLVNTVAVLIIANALVLLFAAIRKSVTPEVILLGIASALALTGIDIFYVARRTIAPIYLADAAVEIALILLWMTHVARSRTSD
jgi:hypothetical protein